MSRIVRSCTCSDPLPLPKSIEVCLCNYSMGNGLVLNCMTSHSQAPSAKDCRRDVVGVFCLRQGGIGGPLVLQNHVRTEKLRHCKTMVRLENHWKRLPGMKTTIVKQQPNRLWCTFGFRQKTLQDWVFGCSTQLSLYLLPSASLNTSGSTQNMMFFVRDTKYEPYTRFH